MKVARQTTLRDHTELRGVGVHSGLPVTLTLHPADADTGLRFVRTRLEGWEDREIPADMSAVTATEFATVLGDASGPLVSTAEHVLAALAGLGVDNAVVEIDGPEAPIMDGSAAPFVAAIDSVGLKTLDRPRRYIKVLKPVRVAKGDAYGELGPNPRGFRVEAEIEFEHALIGRQALAIDVKPETFRDIARARTFGFLRDVASLWNAGYALGASLKIPSWSATTAFSTRRVRVSRTNSFATRYWTLWATWRSRVLPCSALTTRCGAGISSTTRCCVR